MSRFVGYKNRRPYLWCVDLDTKTIEPVGELQDIPQAIDELVPLDDAVAVRCGPHWLAVEPDLSGPGRGLSSEQVETARARSNWVDVWDAPSGGEFKGPEAVLDWRGRSLGTIEHPAIAYWPGFATMGPDGHTVAIGGSTVATRRERFGDEDLGPDEFRYQKGSASVLALVDVVSRDVQICSGRFEEYCIPAWSATGETIVLDAPFERDRLYTVNVGEREIRPIMFKRSMPPKPLLDATLLR